ncbi:hypothetical protein CAEBREN_03030 [Caenorhabditis brenneri]|uniref:F-box domain-containing protein n=1 Tax=Caenorhabditis brenneri TaxID=135651 RepID=G0NR54_CAEBE|nr:hypothetical protein CAEBREN_03030 [Caenorhabditis brenneri]
MENCQSHRPSISDLPMEITSHILKNLNPWEFIQSRKVCKGFKEIVDHHFSLQSWNVKLNCVSYGGTEVSISSPSGYPEYSYSETDTGCDAIYSSTDQISGDVVKIQKTFEGKFPSEIGIEHFGILARNPMVRLNKCDLFLDAEQGEILFKKIFDLMDHKLHIEYLEFFATLLSIIRRVLSHVQPGFLEKISINGFDYAEGEEAEKEAKAVADMSQWKLAKQLWADGYDGYFSLFPIDNFLHAEKFFIELEEITVVDLVRVKEKLFLSPNFKEAWIWLHNDLTIEEFTAGLGSPPIKDVDSPNCITFQIPGTEEYLDFKFNEYNFFSSLRCIEINKRS